MKRPSLAEALQEATDELHRAGLERPEYDARVLVAHVLNCGLNDVFLRSAVTLNPEEQSSLDHLTRLRAQRLPLQHVTGDVWFRGLHLRCDRRALIPRDETEQLVTAVLDRLPALDLRPADLLVDVGCGSGAIALALAAGWTPQQVLATDISPAALQLAAENLERTGLQQRVTLLQGDYLEPVLQGPLARQVAVVVSNPPYIRPADLPTLEPELVYEPALALRAPSEDGLGAYRTLAAQAAQLSRLRLLACEVGHDQAREVAALWRPLGEVEILLDYAGVERFVIAHV